MQIKQSTTFKKWFGKLKDERGKAIIASRLNRLSFGHAGDVAPVGNGISELRIHYGPGYRVYFIISDDVVVVLLCGGNKSTQEKDIRAARVIAAQWSDDDE
ncbi:type II toxin-antitoxin system RelE/ParE family toxin [Agrobacterium pusense]|uniref:type II toxin-antitoxin system RelE/ParE family toxin n=1 Tax=Agrobacterium pusense TaxID=648995 RepID=UPI002414DC0B|nr:type II toxin-antitoxin system RelE/ParE family toxin [Agrobacterium pusense]WFN89169.1 type II toxin-antitoxin system RelE/ParE family toxin [Agrobacterium pusense]